MAGDSAPQFRTNDCLIPTVKSNLRSRPTPTNTTMETKTISQAPTPSICQRSQWKNWDNEPATRSESSDEVHKHPQGLPSESEAGQTRKMKSVVYEVPCKDCPCVYIEETGRYLEKRLSEHKTAETWPQEKYGIKVHAWASQQQVDWEAAKIEEEERGYWKQAHYHQHQTSNLDCGLTLLNSPPCHPWVTSQPLHSSCHPCQST